MRLDRLGHRRVEAAGRLGISAVTTRSRTSAVVSPWKSRSPVSISKSTAPSEKRSLRWSARISTTISGAMYEGLPAR